MHIDDAASFIVDLIRTPRPSDGYPMYGYEVYIPVVIRDYLKEVEKPPGHPSTWLDGPRSRELSPIFYEAAWELCRRGILRPGIKRLGAQAAGEGDGYSVTSFGRAWIAQGAPAFVVAEPGRMGQLFSSLSARLGSGFLQRANEAVLCHKFGTYLACCAMCGAAAESILLSVAIAKSEDEKAILALYRAAHGRRKVVDGIAGRAKAAISEQFRSATGLLSYWRDEASHGAASNISEIEAHEALARLLRFSQFVSDNWAELIGP
jgi:hypothetical protein